METFLKLFHSNVRILCVIISICVLHTVSYNIDTDHAQLFTGPTGSLFGYSTLLLKQQGGFKLLVGAPNDNSTDPITPGSVYVCDVNGENSTCQPFYNKGDVSEVKQEDISPRNLEGFGSCLIQSSPSKVLTCAPRHKDMQFGARSFVIGRCLTINNDISTGNKTILPVTDANKYATQAGYIQGMAESGFSCAGLGNDAYVLGAPGLNSWRGGFAVVKGRDRDNSIINTDTTLQDKYDYLGYSVTGGNFCGRTKLCFASGAPRHNHKGIVGFYEFVDTSQSNKKFDLESPDKDSIGSYFGFTLVSADINGDGWDDLIVGAPFYTKSQPEGNNKILPNEGRVWVYTSRGSKLTTQASEYFQSEPTKLSGSTKSFSQFGYAISNLGDVNGDGIDDVAVGAPYENGEGVVYIYHGSRNGIVVKYSQRINASMVAENITGFGSHISKSLDVDANGYPDVAIGSSMSDAAVLLRTRQIVDLVADMYFDQPIVRLNQTGCPSQSDAESCVLLTVCFHVNDEATTEIEVDYTISVDIKPAFYQRVKIDTPDGWVETITEKLQVTKAKNCKNYTLLTLKEERLRDPFTPIIVQTKFAMNESKFSSNDLIPIVNQTRPNVITRIASFEIECGSDNICDADLAITGNIVFDTGDTFIIVNKTDSIDINVTLINHGESSFGSQVHLSWSNNLSFRRLKSATSLGCTDLTVEPEDKKFICRIFPPIEKKRVVSFAVVMEADDVSLISEKVNFTLQAITSSNDTQVTNNMANLSSNVWIQAYPTISGNSFPSEIPVNKGEENLTFIHKYLMVNDGPSFLPSTDLSIEIPYSYPTGEPLVTSVIAKLQFENGAEMFCTLTNEGLQGSNSRPTTPAIPTTSATSTTTKTTAATTTVPLIRTTTTAATTTNDGPYIPEVEPSRRRRQTRSVKTMDNSEHHINCVNYKCDRMVCKLPVAVQPRESVILNITLSVKTKDLPFKDHDVIRFFTEARVLQPNHPLFFPWDQEEEEMVSTPIFKVQQTAFQIWIPIVCVICALLLLIIIALILKKYGFFKREKKAALQQWKRESGYYKRTSSRNPPTSASS